MDNITQSAQEVITELIEVAHLKEGDLVVVGCSSSEMIGETIGQTSSMDAAKALVEGLLPVLKSKGIHLCAQCCEHLNRALVIEKKVALERGYEEVSAIPQPHAGGSFAVNCYNRFEEPILVEEVNAEAGIDIGNTLIGMHLKRVAVPVRLSVKTIGKAPVVSARTRPKFIGGARAVYSDQEIR